MDGKAGKGRASEPELLRGSLLTIRRKCGTASCHCASGEPHEGRALSVSVDGRTRMVSLPTEALAEVERALARYRSRAGRLEARIARAEGAAAVARRQRAELEVAAAAGLEALRARLAARRAGRAR
ncbi:MAG: DUF6788 family protein [Mycobacteriales bacterium]